MLYGKTGTHPEIFIDKIIGYLDLLENSSEGRDWEIEDTEEPKLNYGNWGMGLQSNLSCFFFFKVNAGNSPS